MVNSINSNNGVRAWTRDDFPGKAQDSKGHQKDKFQSLFANISGGQSQVGENIAAESGNTADISSQVQSVSQDVQSEVAEQEKSIDLVG